MIFFLPVPKTLAELLLGTALAEFDDFKRDIDLRAYAETADYYVDHKESTPVGNPTNWILRRDSDDAKLLLRHTGSCWIYRDLRDNQNRGTVIDFVQHENKFSKGYGEAGFGLVMRELRRYAGSPQAATVRQRPAQALAAPPPVDRESVRAAWHSAKVQEQPAYLLSRGIAPAILRSQRFAGTFRECAETFPENARGNVLFPNLDEAGLLGLEHRNRNFRSQWPEGASKGLWLSQCFPTDTTLVLTESPIEALSYEQLFMPRTAHYGSTGGELSKAGASMLQVIFRELLETCIVLLAFNNDDAGHRLAARVKALAPAHTTVREHFPQETNDWNEQLQANAGR